MGQKQVHELMLPLVEYATTHADSSIKEALEVLSRSKASVTSGRHYHRAVLVLDDEGRVVGKLSHWAILRSLEPKFLKYEDEVSLARVGLAEDFIQSLKERFALSAGGLGEMCRAAGRIKAKDAMVPMGESIDATAPLSEAIHHLVMTHVQSILVTRDRKVVGILRQSDVFEDVAETILAGEV